MLKCLTNHFYKKKVLSFCMCLMFFCLSCNQKEEYSLEIKIKAEDEKEFNFLGEKFYKKLRDKQHDSIIIVGKQLIKFMESRPYLTNGIYAINYELGNAYWSLKKHDSAVKAFKKAIIFFEQEPKAIEILPESYVNTLKGLVNIDRRTENYDNAIKTLYKGLVNLNGKRPDLRSKLFNEIGYVYWYMRDNDKAERMFRKSLLIPEKSEYTKHANYVGLGDVFTFRNLDSALYYFNKANLYFKNKSAKGNYHVNNTNIAQVLIKKGKLSEAKKLLLDAENHFVNTGSKFSIGKVYLSLAEVEKLNKNTDKEFIYLEQAKPFLEHNGGMINLEKLYHQFSEFYVKTANPIKENYYLNKAKQVRNNIYDVKKRGLINLYEIKHLKELNDLKIKSQELLILTQKKQNNWLITGVLMLTSLIFALFILYKQRMRAQKALLRNKEQLAAEKVNTIIESQKVKSMQSHLEGQNKERERIAKDLHDSISGNLAAIKMKLSNVKESHSQEIDSIIKSIDETYSEVRAISHNLLPNEVVKQNFVSVLNQLILLYQSESLTLCVEVFPEEEVNQIDESIQVEVYRILQELITNIIKHANASKGLINITLHENYLNLLIEDNGLGFNPKKKENGIGLSNIFSRTKSLYGTIDMDSKQNNGTTVNINIPIK